MKTKLWSVHQKDTIKHFRQIMEANIKVVMESWGTNVMYTERDHTIWVNLKLTLIGIIIWNLTCMAYAKLQKKIYYTLDLSAHIQQCSTAPCIPCKKCEKMFQSKLTLMFICNFCNWQCPQYFLIIWHILCHYHIMKHVTYFYVSAIFWHTIFCLPSQALYHSLTNHTNTTSLICPLCAILFSTSSKKTHFAFWTDL